MALRLKHKFNSVKKRINGEYTVGLFVALQDLIKNKNEISRLNFKIALFSKYFRFNDNYYPQLYEYLKKDFETKDGVFDFGIFKIPKPEDKDFGMFILEFMDLIFPHVFPRNRYIKYLQEEGHYEQFGVQVEADDIVIDAGANIGQFSAYAAFRGAHVYAFEPIQSSLKYLYKTAFINSELSGRISIVPLALTDRKSTLQFTFDESNIGSASAIIKRNDQLIEIQGVSLDDWVVENKIPKIDFIKADIEGAERNLLLGATNILKKFKPKLAICTYHLIDDPKVLENIILTANSSYRVYHSPKKLFAQ